MVMVLHCAALSGREEVFSEKYFIVALQMVLFRGR